MILGIPMMLFGVGFCMIGGGFFFCHIAVKQLRRMAYLTHKAKTDPDLHTLPNNATIA